MNARRISRKDLDIVLEALRAADTEISMLITADIHIPSGDLPEQLEEAITLLETMLDA